MRIKRKLFLLIQKQIFNCHDGPRWAVKLGEVLEEKQEKTRYMETKEPGYVYILTNPSFHEDWVKIGKTIDLKARLKNLDNTSVPLPFEVFATSKEIVGTERDRGDRF